MITQSIPIYKKNVLIFCKFFPHEIINIGELFVFFCVYRIEIYNNEPIFSAPSKKNVNVSCLRDCCLHFVTIANEVCECQSEQTFKIN